MSDQIKAQVNTGKRMPGALRRADDGFALVAVIWITGILATAAFIATSSASSRLKTVNALISSAEAEAAADAGIYLAIAEISARRQNAQTTSLYTPPIVCRLSDETALRVDVSDEAGKIDLNFASDSILRTLMSGLGWPDDLTNARVAALQDYIDADTEPRANGGEEEQYRDAGRVAGPRNGPLASIFELGHVLGFDAASIMQFSPHVTVHSGQTGIDPLVATPELRVILDAGANRKHSGTSKSMAADAPPLPIEFRTSSTRHALTIVSQGVSAHGTRFIREAVVSFSSPSASRAAQHRIWRWSRGSANGAFGPIELSGALQRC